MKETNVLWNSFTNAIKINTGKGILNDLNEFKIVSENCLHGTGSMFGFLIFSESRVQDFARSTS